MPLALQPSASGAVPARRPTRAARTTVHRVARALCLTTLLAVAACDDAPTAPSGATWTGERSIVTDAGTRIQARLDRANGARHSPTIVLVSGLDAPLELWTQVRTGLSGDAPVFSYDRGGVGRSGAVAGERSSRAVAEELRATLHAAGVRPPYLLVAHSVGGVHARVFADRYRQDVAGVVLVDATHETLLGMMSPDDVRDFAAQQQYPGARAEVLAQTASAAQAAASRLPDVPLAVITSMKPEPGQPMEAREWFAGLQAEWLRQVTRGEQVRTTAGHMVPLEAPEVVLSATRRVLTLARSAR